MINGVRQILESEGLSVYIDWIDDPQLDRTHVTVTTAVVLRRRMKESKTFLYATSSNASESKWMPWEIGFFDGLGGGRIAIFPLVPSSTADFKGQEYLSLYPYIEKVTDARRYSHEMGIRKTASTYIPLREFVAGSATTRPSL
jgi:hypothetical protein